ncbi:MAG: TetR/AcrR family transcriptional regulator [Sphingorhabdus sp.]|nr:TetR/AcrR family transcriptional regulator [Sphingorhabdus sp.]
MTTTANKRIFGSTKTSAMAVRAKRKKPNQAGRPTASELERRKGRVMEVATELFVEHGFAATSLVDVARGAGVATRTLYQHFGDKDAIFREVIFARDSETALQAPTVEQGDTLYSALLKAAKYAYELTYREQSIGLMRLMIAESKRFPEFMQSVAKTIFAHFRSNIEKVLEALAKAGLIPNGDHARSAELFSDLVLGSHPIMTYTNWDAELPGEKDIEERLEMFILGRFGAEVSKTARTNQVQ